MTESYKTTQRNTPSGIQPLFRGTCEGTSSHQVGTTESGGNTRSGELSRDVCVVRGNAMEYKAFAYSNRLIGPCKTIRVCEGDWKNYYMEELYYNSFNRAKMYRLLIYIYMYIFFFLEM